VPSLPLLLPLLCPGPKPLGKVGGWRLPSDAGLSYKSIYTQREREEEGGTEKQRATRTGSPYLEVIRREERREGRREGGKERLGLLYTFGKHVSEVVCHYPCPQGDLVCLGHAPREGGRGRRRGGLSGRVEGWLDKEGVVATTDVLLREGREEGREGEREGGRARG